MKDEDRGGGRRAVIACATATPILSMGDASRWATAANSGRERARAAVEGPMSHNARNWAELPEPLMAKVVRALTFESLVALRRVSHDWRAVVVHLAGACRPNPVVRHLLMVADGTEYACYSPQQDDWYCGSLRFPGNDFSEDMEPRMRASAGGLLLFVAGDLFIVANPLTRAWKELPKIPGKGAEIGTAAMGMCYLAPSKSYLIVVAESDVKGDGSAVTVVFNSLAGEWDVTPGSYCLRGKTFTHELMELIYVNGSFYGTMKAKFPPAPLLVRYRVQQQRWSLGEVGLPCTSSPSLGEVDGQLLLAGQTIATVSVWVFSQAEHKWNVLKAKGMSLVQRFSLVDTVFVGDFLYWKTQDHRSVLVHHLKRHSWNSARELPDYFGCDDFDCDDFGCYRHAYCAFEPSLLASP